MDYFTGRGHSTQVAGLSCLVARINASIIQGSRLGPSSYVVVASDLHPKHRQNKITKFADDTYLLVGLRSIGTVTDEYDNIKKWAETNNMKIHSSQTKELVVTRARTRSMHPPSQPFIEGAERVTTLKVLGVHLNARFTMTDHVSQVLNTCSSSIFALRLLRIHGLQPQELHLVASSDILVLKIILVLVFIQFWI